MSAKPQKSSFDVARSTLGGGFFYALGALIPGPGARARVLQNARTAAAAARWRRQLWDLELARPL